MRMETNVTNLVNPVIAARIDCVAKSVESIGASFDNANVAKLEHKDPAISVAAHSDRSALIARTVAEAERAFDNSISATVEKLDKAEKDEKANAKKNTKLSGEFLRDYVLPESVADFKDAHPVMFWAGTAVLAIGAGYAASKVYENYYGAGEGSIDVNADDFAGQDLKVVGG